MSLPHDGITFPTAELMFDISVGKVLTKEAWDGWTWGMKNWALRWLKIK